MFTARHDPPRRGSAKNEKGLIYAESHLRVEGSRELPSIFFLAHLSSRLLAHTKHREFETNEPLDGIAPGTEVIDDPAVRRS
jgi:hypothetical protein